MIIGKTIIKSIKPKTNYSEDKIKKIINQSEYKTNGEFLIVVKDVESCEITLDIITTEHIVIKALTKVVVKHENLIDGYYHELIMDNGSSVELCEVDDVYYIIASDGLKFE